MRAPVHSPSLLAAATNKMQATMMPRPFTAAGERRRGGAREDGGLGRGAGRASRSAPRRNPRLDGRGHAPTTLASLPPCCAQWPPRRLALAGRVWLLPLGGSPARAVSAADRPVGPAGSSRAHWWQRRCRQTHRRAPGAGAMVYCDAQCHTALQSASGELIIALLCGTPRRSQRACPAHALGRARG